jgi:tetratricopeptide (TPR) repeat protein
MRRGVEAVKPNRPPVDPAVDPLSLGYKSRTPGPDLYVSLARLSERGGNIQQAESQYEKSLELDPNHLDALLGYAHLRDRQNQFQQAIEIYRRAIAAHPNEPRAHNDLGLCYARSGMLEESVGSLSQAVALRPEMVLYRNNLAKVLVEIGRTDDALAHLTSVHGAPLANLGLGFLLHERGQDELAVAHFSEALRLDPTLKQAEAGLAKLGAAPQNQMAVTPVVDTPPAATPPAGGATPSAVPTPVWPNANAKSQGNPRLGYPQAQSNQSVENPRQLPDLHPPGQMAVPPTPDQSYQYPSWQSTQTLPENRSGQWPAQQYPVR